MGLRRNIDDFEVECLGVWRLRCFSVFSRCFFDGAERRSSVREVVLLVEHFVRSFVIQLLFEVPRKEVFVMGSCGCGSKGGDKKDQTKK